MEKRCLKKTLKRSAIDLTVVGVGVLSRPARRKRECRKRKAKRSAQCDSNFRRLIFQRTAVKKVRCQNRANSLEKQRLNCVLRAESAQADCKKSDVNLVGIYASKIIFWRV